MVGTQDDLIGLQFGTNGTLNTASTYRRNLSEHSVSSGLIQINATDNQNKFFVSQMNIDGQIIIDVASPFLSLKTYIRSICDTSDRGIQWGTGYFNNTTSFTDFAFIKDAATSFTGNVSTYGYKKV
jgi:hypothetical protein